MKGYFVDETTGDVVYYGKRSQRPNLETGHIFIPASNPKPDKYDKTYAWDISVEDTSDPLGWIQPQRLLDEKAKQDAKKSLSKTDLGMIRVIEDLVDVLVAKGSISLADLPQSAQDKISTRDTLRGQI